MIFIYIYLLYATTIIIKNKIILLFVIFCLNYIHPPKDKQQSVQTFLNYSLYVNVYTYILLRRTTHLHSIPRGVTANGLRAVLRTLHRPKDPP